MMRKEILTVVFLSLCVAASFGQFSKDEISKWSAGISIAGLDYGDKHMIIETGRYSYQTPRLNISRYMFY
jgi:hypothetical protein